MSPNAKSTREGLRSGRLTAACSGGVVRVLASGLAGLFRPICGGVRSRAVPCPSDDHAFLQLQTGSSSRL